MVLRSRTTSHNVLLINIQGFNFNAGTVTTPMEGILLEALGEGWRAIFKLRLCRSLLESMGHLMAGGDVLWIFILPLSCWHNALHATELPSSRFGGGARSVRLSPWHLQSFSPHEAPGLLARLNKSGGGGLWLVDCQEQTRLWIRNTILQSF